MKPLLLAALVAVAPAWCRADAFDAGQDSESAATLQQIHDQAQDQKRSQAAATAGFYRVAAAAGEPVYPAPNRGTLYETYVCSLAPYGDKMIASGGAADEAAFADIVDCVADLAQTVNGNRIKGLDSLYWRDCQTKLPVRGPTPYMSTTDRATTAEGVLIDGINRLLQSPRPETIGRALNVVGRLKAPDAAVLFEDALDRVPGSKPVAGDAALLAKSLSTLSLLEWKGSERSARTAQSYWNNADPLVRCRALTAFAAIVLPQPALRARLRDEFAEQAASIYDGSDGDVKAAANWAACSLTPKNTNCGELTQYSLPQLYDVCGAGTK